MNNFRLSICIPTYNRGLFLKQNLETIISQFQNKEVLENVEIVVSDNDSPDNTDETVKIFQQKFPNNITYLKNPTNLGFDRNVLSVVNAANGEFVWLLGDDDGLFEYSLIELLDELRKNKAEYYIVNSWGYDNSLTVPAVKAPGFSFKENAYYKNLSDYVKSINSFKDLVGNFGGMSGQVFRREVWQNLSNKEQFVGSQTIHLFVILSAFKNLPFSIFAKPLVKTRSSNMRWDTFPGLESLAKRAKATNKTLIWILDLYNIPYSKVYINLHFYLELFINGFTNTVKKYLFSNSFSKKYIVPKLKILLGK